MSNLRSLLLLACLSLFAPSVHALECAPATCGTVEAHLMPGASAGDKIEAAIAALPSNGGYVDATGFPNPQNLSGFTIPPGVTVKLGPVFHTLPCGSPITVNQGGRLIGSGTNSPGATYIKLFNNCNHNVIELISTAGETDWWHSGELAWIRVDGNKANNTAGNGVAVYQIGEISQIHNMMIVNAAEAGLYSKGGTSGVQSIDNVHVGNNGEAGVRFDEFRSAIYLKSVGGDANPITFHILGARTGGGTIYIAAPKSEAISSINASTIVFEGGSASVNLTLAGGNFLAEHLGTIQKTITILPATPSPYIQIIGTYLGNIGAIVDDQVNGVMVVPDDLGPVCVSSNICKIMDFKYYDGQWQTFPDVGPHPNLSGTFSMDDVRIVE